MFEKIQAIPVVFAVMLWPVSVAAVQVQFEPVKDATLYEDDQGALASGSGSHLFFGKVGSRADFKLRRALIKFDVSSIPADATIEQVSLTLEINSVPTSGGVGGLASLHRVTASWGEGPSNPGEPGGEGAPSLVGDTTWLHRVYPGSLWSATGGDYQPTPSAEEGYGVILEPLVIASTPGLRQDVKAWVSNPAENHGWILLGNEENPLSARRVFARESTGLEVPLLTVDYSIPDPTENLELTEVASGLTKPVVIANANDGSGRLFIVEQAGIIRIFDIATQTLLATPYLDISSIVNSSEDEQGLLGLAFHPNFENNRKFYVYYISTPEVNTDPPLTPGYSVVAVFQQNAESPNLAVSSGTPILEFTQNATNHNAGDMHFDTDGYLYIASGDGGGTEGRQNPQDINSLKGKILRIDVDGSPSGDELCGLVQNYGIPPGNAYPGALNGCDEILHSGLRNPWKFSFDALTGEMYIGDVGQSAWEEIDLAARGASGLNFGWPCREGLSAFTPPAGVTCPNPVNPILVYPRVGGGNECAITGGYVYRGARLGITGYYVYGDYCTGKIWLAKNLNGTWTSTLWTDAAPILTRLSAFGQDQQCELYVADIGAGKIYRIDDDEMLHRSGFEALHCQ